MVVTGMNWMVFVYVCVRFREKERVFPTSDTHSAEPNRTSELFRNEMVFDRC